MTKSSFLGVCCFCGFLFPNFWVTWQYNKHYLKFPHNETNSQIKTKKQVRLTVIVRFKTREKSGNKFLLFYRCWCQLSSCWNLSLEKDGLGAQNGDHSKSFRAACRYFMPLQRQLLKLFYSLPQLGRSTL